MTLSVNGFFLKERLPILQRYVLLLVVALILLVVMAQMLVLSLLKLTGSSECNALNELNTQCQLLNGKLLVKGVTRFYDVEMTNQERWTIYV